MGVKGLNVFFFTFVARRALVLCELIVLVVYIRTPTSPHMGVFSRTNPTAAFNYVISQIASGDVTASTQALVQFERVIRNKNHKEVSKHIDQVRWGLLKVVCELDPKFVNKGTGHNMFVTEGPTTCLLNITDNILFELTQKYSASKSRHC